MALKQSNILGLSANLSKSLLSSPRENSTDPFVGYRVWKLDREGCVLLSVTNGTPWPFRRRLVRDEIHNAGIHAMRDVASLIHGGGPSVFDPAGLGVGLWESYQADVAGSVYLWGEVLQHTEGFLAEFAYPKSLWMPANTDPTIVLRLEENYGVPVTLRPEFAKRVEQPFPQAFAQAAASVPNVWAIPLP